MDETSHEKDLLSGYGHLETSLPRIRGKSRGSTAFW